ncbi:hypothetical protein JCM8208_004819 [Rhodotorula glutinis]
MPRPPLAPSPSDPLPQVVDPAASVIRPPSSAAPPRSPAPPAALKPAPGGRPSLSNAGAASSPALATTSAGSPSSSSVGDRLGISDRSTTTASNGTTSSSTPDTSSDGFPTLAEVDEALQEVQAPAESGAAGSCSTAPHSAEPVAARDGPAPNLLGMILGARDGAQGGVPSSHAWSPPAPGSALGMVMGGLPLALQLSKGAFDPSARRTGICKFFNASKGFGFILDDKSHELGNDEVFVHYTVIAAVSGGPRGFKSLLEGEAVEYSIVQGPKGWQAQDVTGPNGAPCIGTPPGGIPKPSFVPSSSLGSSQSKGGVRRPSVASSPFASPMRSTRANSLYSSTLADDSSRTSFGSPVAPPLRLHMGGQGPAYSNGGPPPSPHLFQPVMMDPYGSPMQHQPPPLPFHLPPFPHDGEQSPHGAPSYYGSPDAGALVHSPMTPGFGSPYGPMHPLGPPPPGMDASQGPPFSPLHAYPSPTSPFFPNGYPISNSPTSPQYPPPHLFSGPGPYPPYPAFLPGLPGPPPPMPMYFDPSSGPPPSPHGVVHQPYPISSAGENGGPVGGPPIEPSPGKVVDAPSGMAIGWAEGDSSPVEDGASLETAASRTAVTKQPAPLPGAARTDSASA